MAYWPDDVSAGKIGPESIKRERHILDAPLPDAEL